MGRDVAKVKNHVVYGDENFLRGLRDEYLFLGRPCEIQEAAGALRLVVFALPPKKNRKDDRGNRQRGRKHS